AAHGVDDEEIAHHQRDDEDRSERDAGLGQWNDDLPDDAPAAAAAVESRFDNGAVDARHCVEDRNDHEQGEQMDVSDDNGEIGEQKKIQRLLGYAEPDERLVEQAVAA